MTHWASSRLSLAPVEEETAVEARRWWRLRMPGWPLHLLLFVLTFGTTTAFGSVLAECFRLRLPLQVDLLYNGYSRLFHLDPQLWTGLSFSVPLLCILLAHELGHYVTCKRWQVDASLPYFLPSPTLLGTFGAFIRIRSPIYSRRALFDIGVSGPIAGFVVLLPFLLAGVWMSRFAVPGHLHSEFAFSAPLLLKIVERMRFGNVEPGMILLHPVAMAAWAGLLATFVNLLPLGQLDGGHILYSLLGERGHTWVATVFVGVLVILGFFYWPWWGWAVLMFFFGRRHPLVYDTEPLRTARLASAGLALCILVLSISVVPVGS